MDAKYNLTPLEAQTYKKILDSISQMPKSDPRFALVIGTTWWLLHRRRRLEQQRIRRRQFFRRFRRLVLLQQLHRNLQLSSGVSDSEMMGVSEYSNMPQATATTVIHEQRQQPDIKPAVAVPAPASPPTPPLSSPKITKDLWERIEAGEISPIHFKKLFHLEKETFEFLCEELRPDFDEKQVAASIFMMANGVDAINCLFGLQPSSLFQILAKLKDTYINFKKPTDDNLEEKVSRSEMTFGITQCIGVLGLVEVQTENDEVKTIQAVVDSESLFSHVYYSLVGDERISNSEILLKSNLKAIIEGYFGDLAKDVNGVTVPVLVATTGSHELEDWVITVYADGAENGKLEQNNAFNTKMSEAAGKFKRAVNKVFKRWDILSEFEGTDNYDDIVQSCFVLHNVCEGKGDFDLGSGEGNETRITFPSLSSSEGSEIGVEVREALARRIFEKNQLLNCYN